MFWNPYINKPAKDTPDATVFRIFAEPQLLEPPFKAAKNPYAPKAIVQLPKIWKSGMSDRMHGPRIIGFSLALSRSHWRF